MALQGTLDTFALAELVRLLANTEKSGELAIDGDLGRGRLWFDDGRILGGEPASDRDAVGALFGLLRMADGTFEFDADVVLPADLGPGIGALDVLAAAEARLEMWRPVEQLVPSPAVSVSLRDEIADHEVTIDRLTWQRAVAVSKVATAGELGERLGLDDVETAFVVRDLVEAGLVEVGPATADKPSPEVATASATEAAPAARPAGRDDDVPPTAEAQPARDELGADAATVGAGSEADWVGLDTPPTIASAEELLSAGGLAGAGDGDSWRPAVEPELAPSEPAELPEVADGSPAAEPPAESGLPDLGDDSEAWSAAPAAATTRPGAEMPIEPLPMDALPSEAPAPRDSGGRVAPHVGPARPTLRALRGGSLSDDGPARPRPAAPAVVAGDMAVDLDSQLGSGTREHSYLDSVGPDVGLPEPLPGSEVDSEGQAGDAGLMRRIIGSGNG